MEKDPNNQGWEEQFRQREIEIRLRKLEAEIDRADAPFHPTVKDVKAVKNAKPAPTFSRSLILAAKLSGFFIGSIVVVIISQFIAGFSFLACIGLAGWMCFELGRKF